VSGALKSATAKAIENVRAALAATLSIGGS